MPKVLIFVFFIGTLYLRSDVPTAVPTTQKANVPTDTEMEAKGLTRLMATGYGKAFRVDEAEQRVGGSDFEKPTLTTKSGRWTSI